MAKAIMRAFGSVLLMVFAGLFVGFFTAHKSIPEELFFAGT